MSMRYYAIDDYGYVLNDDEMNALAKQMNLDDGYDPDTEVDRWDVAERYDITPESEFEGELYPIDSCGNDIWEASENADESLYYIPLTHGPALFGSAPYVNKYYLIKEMREEYPQFKVIFPDDDDEFFKHIRHIVGTTFG